MLSVQNCVPETYVSRNCNVTHILYLKFLVHVILFPIFKVWYRYICIFRSMCAVFNMAVFFNSMVVCFHLSLIRCFLNYFEMVLVAFILAGITFFHIPHPLILVLQNIKCSYFVNDEFGFKQISYNWIQYSLLNLKLCFIWYSEIHPFPVYVQSVSLPLS